MHRFFVSLDIPNAWEYLVLHFAPDRLSCRSELRTQVAKDLDYSGLTPDRLRNGLVILNYLGEAVTADLAQPLVDHLRSMGAKVAGIFMAADRVKADYPWHTIPAWCANHDNWLTKYQRCYGDRPYLYTDHKVICLNRKTSPIRHVVVDRLQDMISRNRSVISRESGSTLATSGTVYVDGHICSRRQHDAPPRRFLQAAVKIITEGNEQGLLNTPESILISEKTFKCFAWRQFPIWISVPGTVREVRRLGFDVFDDLFYDHDYDEIVHQPSRLDSAINTVCRFTRRSTHDLARLRHEHAARLEHNYQRLLFWNQERERLYWKYRNHFIKMFVENHSFRV